MTFASPTLTLSALPPLRLLCSVCDGLRAPTPRSDRKLLSLSRSTLTSEPSPSSAPDDANAHTSDTDNDDNEEAEAMQSMGLPTAFHRSKNYRICSQSSASSTRSCGVWLQAFDPHSSFMYYVHSLSGERRWSPPTNENYVPHDWLFSSEWRSRWSSDGTDCGFSLQALDRRCTDPDSAARSRSCCPESARKYWYQRYRIFSRFGDGISMDESSWFDTTPEMLAEHHAQRMHGLSVLDCFCGVGGNVIQLAKACKNVVAADSDITRVHRAQYNASVYSVLSEIDFVVTDALSLLRSSRRGCIDAVFLSPPWGGPEYSSYHLYDVHHLEPVGLEELLRMSIRVGKCGAAAFLPRNTDVSSAIDCVPPGWRCEVRARVFVILYI
jgi:hypothetical protein